MIEEICISSALLASAKEVFETMIFMDLEECCDSQQCIEGDVLLGSITFSGEFNGCLAICFNFNCAKTIGTNMLGTEPDEEISKEDIYDAIGEVTNMVMGSFKNQIQDSISNLHVSIPIVVSGREIETRLPEGIANKVTAKANIDGEYIAEISLMYKKDSE